MRITVSNSSEELTVGLVCKLIKEIKIFSQTFVLKIIHDLIEPLIIQDRSHLASVSDEFLDSIDVSKILINHLVNYNLNFCCKFLHELFNLLN